MPDEGAVVEVYGEEKVLRAVERLAHLETMADTMRQAVELVREKVSAEPAPFRSNRKKWWFQTAKARKRFFAGLKTGQIHVPYVRTHALSKGWHGKVAQSPVALEGHVTNDVEYGPWVQDVKQQARVHQKRWLTEDQAQRQTEKAVNALFAQAAERWAREG